jgi:thymidylate synthase
MLDNDSYNINKKYLILLRNIFVDGNTVDVRGHSTCEVINNNFTINMCKPLITSSRRKLGYKFALAEAYWILSGDNRVETISPYSKIISKFSDDNITFFGAYGPKIINQFGYVVNCFACEPVSEEKLTSRQAVINIWRENPGKSKDIPCTLSVQFVIRQETEDPSLFSLHCIDTMRSSDAWLGIPYDVFNFSMLSAMICIELRRLTGFNIVPGKLYMNLASSHLYLNSKSSFLYDINDVEQFINVAWPFQAQDFDYQELDVSEFKTKEDFLTHLKNLKEGKKDGYSFLYEYLEYSSKA